MSNNNRLLSLDALRGFDMFFIIGGAGLIASLCNLFPASDVASWLSAQMHHVDWDGFAHHDTIFPLFLFIAGISFPFSLRKQQLAGFRRYITDKEDFLDLEFGYINLVNEKEEDIQNVVDRILHEANI